MDGILPLDAVCPVRHLHGHQPHHGPQAPSHGRDGRRRPWLRPCRRHRPSDPGGRRHRSLPQQQRQQQPEVGGARERGRTAAKQEYRCNRCTGQGRLFA
jgi:hypothetical protein